MIKSEYTKLWLYGLLFKLAVSAWLPLFSDESYYWVWSQHLQLSYYDHPGMISWLIALGRPLEFFGQAFRWPAVFFAHFTLVIWFYLLKDHLPKDRLKLWAFLAFFTPMTGLGSMILTPDLPLVFFWSLSLLFLERAMSFKSLKWYLLLGASLGLGFCAKYHIVLFLPFLFFWLVWKKTWREVKWQYVPLTIIAGLIFCTPVLLWNAQNDWVSFKFQLDHGLGATEWKPKWTWRYLYGQMALIFPTVIYFSVRKVKLTRLTWLPIFAWGPLIFFLLTSFKGKVEANWPSIAYPSLIALAVMSPLPSAGKWLKYTVGLWVLAVLLVASHIQWPWFPVEHKRLKTYELVRYRTLAKVADSYRPFYASTFQMASKIWYETGTPTYKLYGFGRKDFYDFQPSSRPQTPTYFFAAQKWDRLPEWAAQQGHRVIQKYPIDEDYVLFEVKAR